MHAPTQVADQKRHRARRIAATLRGLVLIAATVLGARFLARPIFAALARHVPPARAVLHARSPEGVVPSVLALVDLVFLGIAFLLSVALIATERHRTSPRLRIAARLGLDGRGHARGDALLGGALGGVAFAILMAVLLLAGAFSIAPVPRAGLAATMGGVVPLVLCLVLVGFFEEFVFRGYALTTLAEGIGFPAAAIVTSCWFAFAHAAGADSLAGAASAGLYGLFACATVRATGSIWCASGFHVGWNTAQSAVFGAVNGGLPFAGALAHATPHGPAWLDGGTGGADASVFAFLILAVFLAIALRAPSALEAR